MRAAADHEARATQATLAPLAREEAPVELVYAVLDRTSCTPSITLRYVIHLNARVQLRLARACLPYLR